MAKVSLQKYERASNMMPAICFTCGHTSNTYVERQFSKSDPAKLLIAILLLPVIGVVWALRYSQKDGQAIDIPLCNKHQSHWLLRDIAIVAIALLIPPLLLLEIAFVLSAINGTWGYLGYLFAALALTCVFISLWACHSVQQSKITATRVFKNGDIELNHAHDNFIAELEKRRQMNLEDAKQRQRLAGDNHPEKLPV